MYNIGHRVPNYIQINQDATGRRQWWSSSLSRQQCSHKSAAEDPGMNPTAVDKFLSRNTRLGNKGLNATENNNPQQSQYNPKS